MHVGFEPVVSCPLYSLGAGGILVCFWQYQGIVILRSSVRSSESNGTSRSVKRDEKRGLAFAGPWLLAVRTIPLIFERDDPLNPIQVQGVFVRC